MSLNIQKLKITLNTNIPKSKSIEFTKSMLYHPEYISFGDIEHYPYFTSKQLYPAKYLSQLQYDEVVGIFFNGDRFERMLIENKPSKPTNDADYVSKTNIMTMLQLLFSTKYFIVNNIHQSLDIISHKDSDNSIFYNPFNTKFSYIKVNGKPYTVTKTIWLNDIVNHPLYNKLMKEVRNTIDNYKEKEQDSELEKERNLAFNVPVKFDELSYNLRTNVLPKYRFPYRETSNKIVQKYIDGKPNTRGRKIKSEDVKQFYELFDNLYERYILNNKDITVENKLLDIGIDNINLGKDTSYKTKEIFVLLDLIDGEVNENNKKDVYCPYTNDYLGNLLNNLVYKEHSIKVLDKPRTMYSIDNKESQTSITNENISNVINMQNIAKAEKSIDENDFYRILFDRSNKNNKEILDKVNPLLDNGDIIKFIKSNNTELYDMIEKSLSTTKRTKTFSNDITRLKSTYNTEINIINDSIKQGLIKPDELNKNKNERLKNQLYLQLLNNIDIYENTKPQSLGGRRSIKNKKLFNNNVTKKNNPH